MGSADTSADMEEDGGVGCTRGLTEGEEDGSGARLTGRGSLAQRWRRGS